MLATVRGSTTRVVVMSWSEWVRDPSSWVSLCHHDTLGEGEPPSAVHVTLRADPSFSGPMMESTSLPSSAVMVSRRGGTEMGMGDTKLTKNVKRDAGYIIIALKGDTTLILCNIKKYIYLDYRMTIYHLTALNFEFCTVILPKTSND